MNQLAAGAAARERATSAEDALEAALAAHRAELGERDHLAARAAAAHEQEASRLAEQLDQSRTAASAAVDEPALAAFAGGSPHGDLMADLAKEMGPTKFIRWTMKGSEGKPSWREALKRLD